MVHAPKFRFQTKSSKWNSPEINHVHLYKQMPRKIQEHRGLAGLLPRSCSCGERMAQKLGCRGVSHPRCNSPLNHDFAASRRFSIWKGSLFARSKSIASLEQSVV